MAKPLRRGAEEDRDQLPELLTEAQHGRQTLITRHGKAIAVASPISNTCERIRNRRRCAGEARS